MKIKERLERYNEEDVVIIGNLVEKHLRGEFGELFYSTIENLSEMELQNSRNQVGTSDKVLGRLEAYNTIVADFKGYVEELKKAQKPLEKDDANYSVALEQQVRTGGEI
jgi:hypothetical protein